jgi:response regulator RpfG family c-di-GMP phosphodiesterase
MTDLADDARVTPSRLLVVDDDDVVRGAIGEILRDVGYEVTLAAGAEQALALARQAPFPVVISDMKMPGRDGRWLLRQLGEYCPDTAVVLLTAVGDTEVAVECLREGAYDYLLKPPRGTELIRAIEQALGKRRLKLAREEYHRGLEKRVRDRTAELQRALRDLETTYSTTLWALVAALDAREHEVSNHSQRVVRYTLAIARRLDVPEGDLPDLGRGALLHDIGKIGIPDAILLKPAKLTDEEWVEMRRHPGIGFEILQAIPFLGVPAEIVLSHQERFDGRGYPRGLAGEAIPLGARVFAIADTFDAMTSDRPYRKRNTAEAARAEVERCAGSQFDPRCAEAFLSIQPAELEELARPTEERPV